VSRTEQYNGRRRIVQLVWDDGPPQALAAPADTGFHQQIVIAEP
jgi:hypothetical protein